MNTSVTINEPSTPSETLGPGSIRRRRTYQAGFGESMTEQHHKDDVNILSIIKKYDKTGIINHTAKHAGTYSDMISAPDFQEAQYAIAQAETMFESIPARIRQEFDNDPANFLGFIQNPQNREAIEEYGFDTSHLPECVAPAEQGNGFPDPTQGNTTPPKQQNQQIDIEEAVRAGIAHAQAQGDTEQ